MSVGFFGKLPARGDFVRSGLPRSFTDPWDAWFQRGLAFAQAAAPDWTAAWLEAPVWRFRLSPGCCGEHAVLGLWLPSVDRANRYFPLTIAVIGPATPGFLDEAEQAGLDALAYDLDPADLAARLQTAHTSDRVAWMSEAPSTTPPPETASQESGTIWWTQGGVRVPPTTLQTPALPEAAAFAAMIDPDWHRAETAA